MVGRIGSYVHSDSITENKGCAVVKVECDTDFAARTEAFKVFCSRAAKFAYAANPEGEITWADVATLFPELETERAALSKELKEKIEITEIAILRL